MNSSNDHQARTLYLDKILLAIAGSYFLLVVVWLVSQGKLRVSGTSQPQQQSASQTKLPSATDAKFIAYLQQSLELIERQPKNFPQPASAPVATVLKVPTAAVPRSSTPQPQNPSRVVERIYVPIYPQTPSLNAVPFSPPQKAVSVPPPPPITPIPASVSSVPVLTPGKYLLPTSTPMPASGYTLVGLLESGERSYALFNLNGVTKRLELGEVIGTTGWIFHGIEQQKVIVARNSKARYVEVGQTF